MAFYSYLMWSPASSLQIQPGLRIPYNSKYKAPLVYSLNLKFSPGKFNLRASYARGFRTPSLKELYMEFIDQNHQVFGNDALKAETANNYNLSAGYLFGLNKHHLN
ncbi:MAG: TonB-dependent receptor [Bacteroidales bacterium]|nr:TonB-dependent receptor [Bacteroidales bacterium]